jgi:putative membrane protein
MRRARPRGADATPLSQHNHLRGDQRAHRARAECSKAPALQRGLDEEAAMAHEKSAKIGSAFAVILSLAGASACGESRDNPPPQTPADLTATTSGVASTQPSQPTMAELNGTPGYAPGSGGATPAPLGGSDDSTVRNPPPVTGNPVEVTAGTVPSAGGATAGDGAPMDDGQIVAALEAANRSEVEQAREAERRTKNARVSQFAREMVHDYRAADDRLAELNEKDGIAPHSNPIAEQLRANGAQLMLTLRSSSDADFDKAFVDAQVTEHDQVLELLDVKLIPRAQNADLTNKLREIRSKVAVHLSVARALQASLAQR